MSDLELRVCVLALTEQRLMVEPPELRQALVPDLAQQVYGRSADDWRPFADGKNILEHLAAAGIEPISLSGEVVNWANPKTIDAVLRDTDLFLMDPLFFFLAGIPPDFIGRLDTKIEANQRGCCLIHHRAIPNSWRPRIEQTCRTELRSCFNSYQRGEGEFKADDVDRLTAYLSRLVTRLRPRPNPATWNDIGNFFARMGIAIPDGLKPTLGRSL